MKKIIIVSLITLTFSGCTQRQMLKSGLMMNGMTPGQAEAAVTVADVATQMTGGQSGNMIGHVLGAVAGSTTPQSSTNGLFGANTAQTGQQISGLLGALTGVANTANNTLSSPNTGLLGTLGQILPNVNVSINPQSPVSATVPAPSNIYNYPYLPSTQPTVQPTYQQPVYQQPTYQQPVYQQPTYQQPVYQQPATNTYSPYYGN